MDERTFHWNGRNGTMIFGREWQSGMNDAARAVLGILHGFGEHSGSYAHMAQFFTAAGLAVFSFDQYGHGRSTGRRGHIPDYDALLDNVDRLLDEIGRRHPRVPVFLYGHSMGGNILANHLLRRKPEVSGAVIASPWFKLVKKIPPVPFLLSVIAARFGQSAFTPDYVLYSRSTKDDAMQRFIAEDPLRHRRMSLRLYNACRKAGRHALDHAAELEVPVLVMHGGADEVTAVEASRQFTIHSRGRADYVEWPGFRHELHTERGRDDVFRRVLEWIDSRL